MFYNEIPTYLDHKILHIVRVFVFTKHIYHVEKNLKIFYILKNIKYFVQLSN